MWLVFCFWQLHTGLTSRFPLYSGFSACIFHLPPLTLNHQVTEFTFDSGLTWQISKIWIICFSFIPSWKINSLIIHLLYPAPVGSYFLIPADNTISALNPIKWFLFLRVLLLSPHLFWLHYSVTNCPCDRWFWCTVSCSTFHVVKVWIVCVQGVRRLQRCSQPDSSPCTGTGPGWRDSWPRLFFSVHLIVHYSLYLSCLVADPKQIFSR